MSELSLKKPQKKNFFSLRRLKNAILILIALSVIFLAISFTLIRVAIKSIPDYSLAIQKAVSEQTDMTIDVGFMDAEIYWLVPRLNLFDVNISDNDGVHHLVHLDEVDLSLDWSESIRTLSPIVGEITLMGLNLQVEINEKSQLLIQNYVVKENVEDALNTANAIKSKQSFEISEAFKENFNNINFKVLNSQIDFSDARNKNRNKKFSNLNLHLINNGSSHVFEVKTNLSHKYGRYAHFIIDIEGDLFDYKKLDGKVYLALEDINVASWLDDYWSELNIAANGNVNGRVWLAWRGEEIIDITSRVDISNIALHYLDETVKTWSVDQIGAQVKWSKSDEDWRLDIRDLVVDREGINWLKPAAVTLNVKNSEERVTLQADFLRIEGFVYLAGMINSAADLDVAWLNLLDQYKPSGQLENLDVKLPLNALHDIKLNTQFSQIGFNIPNGEPTEVKNLQGKIAYLDMNTWLILDSENTEVKFDQLFRNSIFIEKLKGNIKLSHQDKVWKLASNSLKLNTPHIQTELRVDFNMPDEGRGFLDLTTQFKNGEATAVSQYLPAGVMGKGAVAWIDRALSSGKILNGGYQFYGYLTDAPFRKNEGISLADFNVSGVDLTYLKNWPSVKNISANLRFVNDTMTINAKQARLFDSKISATTVYIDNFISPTLDVKGNVDVNLQDIKKFVNGSPLRADVTDYIDNLKLKGKGKLNLELFLPLYGDYKTEVGGRLVMDNGGLLLSKENYELSHINGEIRFVGDTVESTNLTARVLDDPTKSLLDINVSTKNKDRLRTYHVNINGNILAGALLAPLPVAKPYLSGRSFWDIAIDINNDQAAKKTTVNARLFSDLQGVITKFPGPLAKSKTGSAPVAVNIDINGEKNVNYKLRTQNKDFIEVKQTQDYVKIFADAHSVKGRVEINVMDNVDLPMEINLEYLNLSRFFNVSGEKVSDSAAQLSNENKATDERKAGTVGFQQNVQQTISPRKIPSFDLEVKKLIWKQTVYNDSHLKIQKSRLGAVIDNFKFMGADHIITGKGSWFTGKDNVSTTKLDLNIKVNDLGKVFKELDISDSLFLTSGNINLRWSWQDAPYNFDWKNLHGDGQIELKDGVWKELDAGAGRILGFLNFKTLLSLDFGSQMEKGFNFDKVKGSFTFSNENIYSDDFKIESKVATIFLKGKLSVANNTIDQTITVRPHLGGTVTLGTAFVAGPAAGGLVFLFQKIFNTDRLSEYQYTMKGAVDNPEVKLLAVPMIDEEEDSDF